VTAADPDAWRALALAPPFALGGPVGEGVLRASAEDFLVDEQLGFEPDGGSAHLLLHVEKRERDTLAVAGDLARLAGVASRDVGFAGLKDRVAVARQWFTVPSPREPVDWVGLEGRGFRVLAAAGQSRKLRRGALAGNAFTLVLREVTAPVDLLEARLAAVAAHGVPNYFGPQRFGRDGSNLDAIAWWLNEGRLPRGREGRAFVLSAARSLLFNAVLAARVADGSWNRLLEGECINLAGRNSWFVADAVDATLEERLLRHDVHPTGPLVGTGRGPGGAAAMLEARVLEPFAALRERLEGEGLEAARRALRLVPGQLQATREGAMLTLGFSLPSGAYATALIREVLATAHPLQESDDA
jgi:tRNA pseudouridine13 synthase